MAFTGGAPEQGCRRAATAGRRRSRSCRDDSPPRTTTRRGLRAGVRVAASRANPGGRPHDDRSGMTLWPSSDSIDPPRAEAADGVWHHRGVPRGGHPHGDDHRRPSSHGACHRDASRHRRRRGRVVSGAGLARLDATRSPPGRVDSRRRRASSRISPEDPDRRGPASTARWSRCWGRRQRHRRCDRPTIGVAMGGGPTSRRRRRGSARGQLRVDRSRDARGPRGLRRHPQVHRSAFGCNPARSGPAGSVRCLPGFRCRCQILWVNLVTGRPRADASSSWRSAA